VNQEVKKIKDQLAQSLLFNSKRGKVCSLFNLQSFDNGKLYVTIDFGVPGNLI